MKFFIWDINDIACYPGDNLHDVIEFAFSIFENYNIVIQDNDTNT